LEKAVAQAIPVFAITMFNIPKNICKGITEAISQFWWGDDDEHKRMHLVGGKCVFQKIKVGWVSETYTLLIQ
jgi:hypothetical protein